MTDEQPEVLVPENTADQPGSVPARLSEVLPDRLLVLPLKARPFFPAQTMPIVIEEKLWLETIDQTRSK